MSSLQSYWGKDKTFRVTVTDVTGLVDLTGKGLSFTAKLARTDPDPPLVTKSLGSGIALLNQATNKGQADISIDPVDTNSTRKIHPGRETVLEWDLELTDSGNFFIVDSGTWKVDPPVKRV